MQTSSLFRDLASFFANLNKVEDIFYTALGKIDKHFIAHDKIKIKNRNTENTNLGLQDTKKFEAGFI